MSERATAQYALALADFDNSLLLCDVCVCVIE